MSVAARKFDPSRVRLLPARTHDPGLKTEETWTTAHLDAVVRNFLRSRHLYQPLIVVGHVKDQWDGTHTTVPAYGVVNRVWREGDDLYGSFAELSPSVEQWFADGYLRSWSVELYHDARSS